MSDNTDMPEPEDDMPATAEPLTPRALVAVQQPQPNLSLIEKALAAGVTDADYLAKMVDLQQQQEERSAQAEYNRAMNAAQREMPAVTKDSENKFNQTKYASLEAVMRAIQPVYVKNGFALSFGQEPLDAREGWMRVFVDVCHVEGHTRRYFGDFPLDSAGAKGGSNKTAIQAVGSAFSYARRYLLGLVFNLVFTNEDNDGQPLAAEPTRKGAEAAKGLWPQQADIIDQLLNRVREGHGKAGLDAAWNWIDAVVGDRVDHARDIPSDKFEQIKKGLEAKANAAPKPQGAAK